MADELKSTSFCTYFDNRIWIGTCEEFIESDIYAYNSDCTDIIPEIKADRYIEAPKKSQGMCFYKSYNTVYLGISTSFGRGNNSVIRCYKPKDYYDPKNKYKGVPMILKNDAYRTITMPSMSEQISVHGVFMYCIYESAANKYVTESSRPIGSFCVFAVDKIFK